MSETTRVVHLLPKQGTAPAACGSTMGQRTAHEEKVTCPFCRDAAGLPRQLPPGEDLHYVPAGRFITLCNRPAHTVPTTMSNSDQVTCEGCLSLIDKMAKHGEPVGTNANDRAVMANMIDVNAFEALLDGREVTWKKEAAWGPNRRGVYGTFRDDGGREVTVFAGVYRLSTGKWVVCHERVL